MARIRLSPSASVTPTAAGVVLRSDLGTFQLDGRDVSLFVTEMLPLLDGGHDRDEVAAALRQYSRESIVAFLDLLEQHGLLEQVPEASEVAQDERWRGQEEFFRKWTDRPDETMQTLRKARILIAGLEPWGVMAAAELAAAGVGALHLLDDGEVTPDDLLSVRCWDRRHLGRPRQQALLEELAATSPWCRITAGPLVVGENGTLRLDGTEWDLLVAALRPDDVMALLALARFAQRTGITALAGQVDGLDATVGPVVVPGETACWNCWRLRRLANAEYPEVAHALQASWLEQRPAARMRTYLAPMPAILGHLLALEALKLVSHYTPSSLVGRLMVQNLVTLETTVHTVVRMPWCEVCGGADGGGTPPGGAVLYEQDATEGSAALEEVQNPEDVRRLLAGWVDGRNGVISYLVLGSPESDEPELPVTSSAFLAPYTDGTYHPQLPEIGSGKGLSSTAAMIGAVGEAIERYSAARYRKDHLHRSSFRELRGDSLDPRRLCLYSEAQYAEPDFPFCRFDPDQPIDWVQGEWLDSGEPVWVPALPTYFNFHVTPAEQFCQVTSNGLAAGSDLKDAATRAVWELAERDAFMLSWLCRRPAQQVLPDGTLEVGVREVIRQLEESGVEIELYLLDAGIAIPTMVCLGLGDGGEVPAVTVSLAAHPSPRVAIRKAVLEQGHVGSYIRRLMLSGGQEVPARPESVRTLTDHGLYYVRAERLVHFDFLRSQGGTIPLSRLKEPTDMSLRSCVEPLRAAGVRVALVNVTSPDVAGSPFRVVRALGTDMQPVDFGFKLRRLGNPRLHAMLNGAPNPQPHPLA